MSWQQILHWKLAEYNKTFTDHFTKQEQTTPDICNDHISDSFVKHDVMD